MKADLEQIKKDIEVALQGVDSLDALQEVRVAFLGRKEGRMTSIMKGLKNLSIDEKREIGPLANDVRTFVTEAIDTKQAELEKIAMNEQLASDWIDVTADVKTELHSSEDKGALNPNTLLQYELEDLFTSLGFSVLDGPELGSDFFNFEAINIPKNHPARDMQDTFYIKDHPSLVMRTHTSEMQVRAMLKHGAPLNVAWAGRCFRNEATDARHEHTLYQMEGVIVDENINYANLKHILSVIVKSLYGQDAELRFNPKFYPFVEPGFSGDVTCYLCKGEGCSVCKHTGWLEFFGAGVIHPNVLRAAHIDTDKYQGIAFGLGLSRMAMLKYSIDDARHIQSGDLKFLKQF
jgi:phenylalanyl-tRNA synthetase alpha chain